MVFAQSEMLQKEVYLFERIDTISRSGGRHDDTGGGGESMKYLKCIVFLRPTEDNIAQLQCELKNPRYGQYHVCKCPFASALILKSCS